MVWFFYILSCYKLDRENELFLKRQQSLKDSNEASNREKAEFEEKLRQSQSKNTLLTKNIKDLNEEVYLNFKKNHLLLI